MSGVTRMRIGVTSYESCTTAIVWDFSLPLSVISLYACSCPPYFKVIHVILFYRSFERR